METFVARSALAVLLILCAHSPVTRGHGRMVDPPSRASMWRYGFQNPENYEDTAMYCGGFDTQWGVNGGRCGMCGDPYNGPRDHEAGGKYANGIIVRQYRAGETISVSIELTTSHKGYFEFRLCPNNDPTRAVTQQCLDRYLLKQPDGSTRFYVRSNAQGVRTVRLTLPPGLTCSQCVLQWKYNAGNSWGCEGQGVYSNCCVGCGRQEQYYACADVAITSSASTPEQGQATNTGGHAAVVVPGQNSVPATQYATPSPNPQYVPPSPQFVQSSGPRPAQLSPYYNLCHGKYEALTEQCRRFCSIGPCSTVYCPGECQWLRPSFDETGSDEAVRGGEENGDITTKAGEE